MSSTIFPGFPIRDAAELIAQSGVDVLVDLNGYSAEWRLPLLAARPVAPILGWFNLYATSGMDAYDCLVGDAVVIPPEEEQFYCERIARVPGTYLAFEVGYATPDVTAPPSLQGKPLAFGSLASQYKITPDLIAAWSEILRQAPASTLLLKNAGLSGGNAKLCSQPVRAAGDLWRAARSGRPRGAR